MPATGFNPVELPMKGELFGSIPKPVSPLVNPTKAISRKLPSRPAWVISILSSIPLPAFIGRDFETTTASSATSHHNARRPGRPLEVVHPAPPSNDARLPRLKQTPGEQCFPQAPYETDRITGCVLLSTLTASVWLNQVRFRYEPFISYRFLQPLPLPATSSESSPRSVR